MPTAQGVVTILTGAVNDNLLTGSQWEFLPYDALLEFGLTADATNGDDLRIDIYSGQDLVCESLVPSLAARTPIYPDDFVGSDVAAAGERLKIRARNVGAGTATLNFQVRITPT